MKKTAVLALTLGLCVAIAAPSFAAKPMNSTTPVSKQQFAAPAAPDLKLIKTLKGEDSYSMTRPAFSRDGKFLAANLTETKAIRIWDTQTGEVLSDLQPSMLFGDNQLVDGLEFTPDGQRLVVIRAGYPLKEIDWRKQEVTRSFDLGISGNKIEDYAFCPMFKVLVMATPTGIDMWDFEKGTKMTRLMDGEYINSLSFSKDGKWVAFGKRGPVEQSIGLVDVKTQKFTKYPLANITEAQQKMFPGNYQVRHVSFENGNRTLMVGYMALPTGAFQPTGPAGVFMVDMDNGRMMGPKPLTSNMLSFDPVELGKPFNTTFFNSFDMSSGRTASAADFFSSDLSKVKTLTDADLNAPMLTFRVSPDQKWMAGSFKETDGKVRMRLYEITPERNDSSTQIH
jgi:hypothetical protein